MTLIKGMGLRTDYPPPSHQTNPKLDICIRLGTYNEVNQGNRVNNSPAPPRKHQKNAELDIAIELTTHNDIIQGNGVKN